MQRPVYTRRAGSRRGRRGAAGLLRLLGRTTPAPARGGAGIPWRCGDKPWAARTASRAAPHSPRAPLTPCPTRHVPHSSHACTQQPRPAQRTEATVQPGIVDAGARGQGCPRRHPRRDLCGRCALCGRCGGPWGGLWAGAAAVGYAQSEQVACPARRASPAPGSEGRVHAQQCGAARGTPGREIRGGGAAARRAREGRVVEQPTGRTAPPEARVEHEPERHRPRRIPSASCAAAAAAAAAASSTTSAANAAISASSASGPSASF